MTYFVTGGTGFIGRFLIDLLLEREGTVFVLVRKNSVKKLDALRARWGSRASRVVAVQGDLEKPKLGVSPAENRGRPGGVVEPLPTTAASPRRRATAAQPSAIAAQFRRSAETLEQSTAERRRALDRPPAA